MQSFVDYYSNFFARRLFRQRRKEALTKQDTHEPTADMLIPAEDKQTDLLDYAIFFNEGCGYQPTTETQGQDDAYLQRWLTFYQPHTDSLPQHQNIQNLEARQEELNEQHATLNSPLLAGIMLCVIIATILSLKANAWLLLTPVALFILIWSKTQPAISANTQQMQENEQALNAQQDLLAALKTQTKQNPTSEAASLYKLRENYTRCLEAFLHNSISEFVPELTPLAISENIQAGKMQLYALESRGILQIPNIFPQHDEKMLSLDTLIHKTGQGWCAVQPHEELRGLTRLHYFYGIIRLEHGAIICSAFYDWVGNTLYAEQRDYCSYQSMTHIRQFETEFPTENVLADDLTDEVYQVHFGESVKVIALSVRNGDHYYCALPANQPARKTTIDNLPNTLLCRHLRHDGQQLVNDLSQRIEAHRQDTTAPPTPIMTEIMQRTE